MPSPLADAIRDLVVNELRWEGSRDQLTDDYGLLDSGVLDSLAILKLVSLLEERFSIEIDDMDLIPEHFETIASMAALVESKTNAGS
jgi:methoxymalonate biosynthesis acyl carrier protein